MAFIASSSCFGFWYGVLGLTPITWMLATVRNRCQSLMLGVERAERLVGAEVLRRARGPGVAVAAAASNALLVPIEPEAPGWLTTTIVWPSTFSSSAAVTRVIWSVEPPGAQGTIRLIGRVGFQFWARRGAGRGGEQGGDEQQAGGRSGSHVVSIVVVLRALSGDPELESVVVGQGGGGELDVVAHVVQGAGAAPGARCGSAPTGGRCCRGGSSRRPCAPAPASSAACRAPSRGSCRLNGSPSGAKWA